MRHQDWEKLAHDDPMWAICADGSKKGGRWDHQQFFASGETEIGRVFNHLAVLGITPDLQRPALDFGCGVGRLTRALGNRFTTVYGADITPTMIARGREWNSDRQALHFVQLGADNLAPFSDGMFGFIYSSLVLQHIKPAVANHYIEEFMRVAETGAVVVFQLADSFILFGNVCANETLHNLKNSIRVRTRVRDMLHTLRGISDGLPILRAYGLQEQTVRQTISANGGRVVDVQLTNSLNADFNGRLVFLAQGSKRGWVSKQYCVIKE